MPSSATNRDARSKHLRKVSLPITDRLLSDAPFSSFKRRETTDFYQYPYIKGLFKEYQTQSHNTQYMHILQSFQPPISRPKDSMDQSMRSGVMYLIPCANCDYVYISETGYHLSTHIKQPQYAVRNDLILTDNEGTQVVLPTLHLLGPSDLGPPTLRVSRRLSIRRLSICSGVDTFGTTYLVTHH